ncbi:class I tRNA ligase family protein, partial [Candidatus Gracilibacteria bacterium]|nr:class I tRNA ligase family protein [Candidatus Gracilibacteria bacterium]
SPLAFVPEFIQTTCPRCGKPAERECDTMDTFVDSSWYFLRYPSARAKEKPFDRELTNHWMPVDMYIGGPEHACMHLLYARFIHMVMRDLGYVDTKEPFKRLVHQGLVTKDGAKMSKSKGNVVSPDEFVERYGSDIFRMYLMFMGPFEAGGDWNDQGITGVARFVDRFWTLMTNRKQMKASDIEESVMRDLQRNIHKTLKKVHDGIEAFTFNTAIAGLMEFVNEAMKTGIDTDSRKIMVRTIAPLAPHLAEEIWEFLGEKDSIFNAEYPEHNPELLVEDSVEIAIQINGKVRGTITIAVGTEKDSVLVMAKAQDNIKKYLEGVSIKKEIYVPGKMVSFVI